MPSQDFDFNRRNDFLRELRAERMEAKRPLREALQDEVAKYLAKGGTVKELPSPPRVPRQPSKNLEPYPKRPNPKPFYDHKYNKLLREWLNAVDGRAKNLAAESGYSDTWISARRHGFNQFLLVDYEILKPAMERIENHEESNKLKQIAQKYLGKGNEKTAQEEA